MTSDKSSSQRLSDLQREMTYSSPNIVHPGAATVFTEFHKYYGLPGIEALYGAGYSTPQKLYEFWNDECDRSDVTMAQKLGLK